MGKQATIRRERAFARKKANEAIIAVIGQTGLEARDMLAAAHENFMRQASRFGWALNACHNGLLDHDFVACITSLDVTDQEIKVLDTNLTMLRAAWQNYRDAVVAANKKLMEVAAEKENIDAR